MEGQISMHTMRPKVVKIGYARIVYPHTDNDTYISYREMAYYSDEYIKKLKDELDNGRCRLCCACSEYDDLELSITVNNILRVKNNGLQDKHKESCPKSVRYGVWLAENMDGAGIVGESEKVVLQITLPGVGSSSSASSSSSDTVSTGSHKMKILEMF